MFLKIRPQVHAKYTCQVINNLGLSLKIKYDISESQIDMPSNVVAVTNNIRGFLKKH